MAEAADLPRLLRTMGASRWQRLRRIALPLADQGGRVAHLHGHCHQKAEVGTAATLALHWRATETLGSFARLTRAAVMSEKEREYVTAARVAGAKNLRLMFRTILPNCLGPLIVQATLSFSNAILDAAALGFLGMGAQPPTPEWGTMLAEAQEFVLRAWWVVTFPGLAILVTVLAINLIGDGLRDALDPRIAKEL